MSLSDRYLDWKNLCVNKILFNIVYSQNNLLCSVISRGKVVALDRWGGKWNHLSMAHRLTTNCAKNYCNRTIIVKDIVENVVTCFLGTRCIRPITRTKVIWQGDIVPPLDGAVVWKRNLVDIFYHIRQVAAPVVKLVLGCIWDPILGKGRSYGVSNGTVRKSDGGFL